MEILNFHYFTKNLVFMVKIAFTISMSKNDPFLDLNF